MQPGSKNTFLLKKLYLVDLLIVKIYPFWAVFIRFGHLETLAMEPFLMIILT